MDTNNIFGVRKEELKLYWERVSPILNRAIKAGNGEYDLVSVYDEIKIGKMFLLVIMENNTIVGCCVFQIMDYPKQTQLFILFLAGKVKKYRKELDEKITQLAKQFGCDVIATAAIPAVARVLEREYEYKATHTVLIRSL